MNHLGSATLVLRSSDATIQAMVRWPCPESIRTYAHMEPAEYEKFLLSAISAPITSRLSVSFSSVPCLVSTVPFPMTSPYVGGTSSFS